MPGLRTASAMNGRDALTGPLGTLCTNQCAVCICGLGRSAAQANTRNGCGYGCGYGCVFRLAAHPDPQRTLAARFVQKVSTGTKTPENWRNQPQA